MAKISQGERIQKVLSARGVVSRRKAEDLIRQGRVSVNGKTANLGDRVYQDSAVCIDGKRVETNTRTPNQRVLLYNKPEGEICTRSDPANRPTVFRNLPVLNGNRWVVVGRLDINTQGLLLFTNDGGLANELMHPSQGIEREYICRVFGHPDKQAIKNLKDGIKIDGEWFRFEKVKRLHGENANVWYSVVLTRGRYREIRRMWSAVNCRISRLSRIRFGNIALPRGIRPGSWLELSDNEINQLLSADTAIVTPKIKGRIGKRGRKH